MPLFVHSFIHSNAACISPFRLFGLSFSPLPNNGLTVCPLTPFASAPVPYSSGWVDLAPESPIASLCSRACLDCLGRLSLPPFCRRASATSQQPKPPRLDGISDDRNSLNSNSNCNRITKTCRARPTFEGPIQSNPHSIHTHRSAILEHHATEESWYPLALHEFRPCEPRLGLLFRSPSSPHSGVSGQNATSSHLIKLALLRVSEVLSTSRVESIEFSHSIQ